jgi:hypothetical protein
VLACNRSKYRRPVQVVKAFISPFFYLIISAAKSGTSLAVKGSGWNFCHCVCWLYICNEVATTKSSNLCLIRKACFRSHCSCQGSRKHSLYPAAPICAVFVSTDVYCLKSTCMFLEVTAVSFFHEDCL